MKHYLIAALQRQGKPRFGVRALAVSVIQNGNQEPASWSHSTIPDSRRGTQFRRALPLIPHRTVVPPRRED